MHCCAVSGCQSTSRHFRKDASGENPITFHSFPQDLALREQWIKFCGRSVPVHAVICSLHFQPGLIKHCGTRAIIQPDAIPNLNGPKVTGISYPIVTAGKVKLTDFQEETQRNVTQCCVPSCGNKIGEVASFEFPSDNKTATVWAKFCNLSPEKVPKDSKMCSKHFNQDSIYYGEDGPKLKKGTLPCVSKSSEYQTVFVEYKGSKPKKYVTAKRLGNKPSGPTVNLSFNNLPTIHDDSSNVIEWRPRSNTSPKIIPVAAPVTSGASVSKTPETFKYFQSERGPKRLRLDGSNPILASILNESETKKHGRNSSIIKSSGSALTVEPVQNTEKTRADAASEITKVFKEAAQPPWTFIETKHTIKLCRVDHIDECDLTILGMVVTFDKSSRKVNVTSRGEELQASCFSPKDFEFPTSVLKMEAINAINFVNSIKRTPYKWNPFGMLNSSRTTIKAVLKLVESNIDTSSSSRPTPLEVEKDRVRNYFPALKMVHDQLQAVTGSNPWIEDSVEMASELRSLSVPCYNYLRSTKSLLLPPERFLKKLKAPIDKFGTRKTKQVGEVKRAKPVIIPLAGQEDNEIRTIFVAHDPLLISNYQPIVVEDGGDSLQGIIFEEGNIEEVVSECSVFSQVSPEGSLKKSTIDPSEEIIYSTQECDQEDQLVDSSCITHAQISTQHEFEVGVELLESWVDTN